MIKTAVIGASGNVGRHLLRAYRSTFPDCIGTAFSATHPTLALFDVRRPNIAQLRLEETEHQAVVIAAAKPNIAFCEQRKDEAYVVNVQGTLEVIRQIGRTPLQVIFLSSDYVFEGRTGRYDDDAQVAPTTEYGRQKAFVEKEIPSLSGNFLILRLSKIYGVEKGDGTLLDEMALSLVSGRDISAATDQIFCPTHVGDLVRAVAAIQARGLKGVMNVCSPERWSRCDIALALADAMQADRARVKPVSLHDIPSMMGRPLDTTMRCSRLATEVEATFTPLSVSLPHIVTNWRKP